MDVEGFFFPGEEMYITLTHPTLPYHMGIIKELLSVSLETFR